LLAVHQGLPVSSVAKLFGVTRQSVYNWIAIYGTVKNELDLKDAPRSGRPPLWASELDWVVTDALNRSPKSYGYTAEEWTAGILRLHIFASQKQWFSSETVRRRLRQLGYLWKGGRYFRAAVRVEKDEEASASTTQCKHSVTCQYSSVEPGLQRNA
jgi:transposase